MQLSEEIYKPLLEAERCCNINENGTHKHYHTHHHMHHISTITITCTCILIMCLGRTLHLHSRLYKRGHWCIRLWLGCSFKCKVILVVGGDVHCLSAQLHGGYGRLETHPLSWPLLTGKVKLKEISYMIGAWNAALSLWSSLLKLNGVQKRSVRCTIVTVTTTLPIIGA